MPAVVFIVLLAISIQITKMMLFWPIDAFHALGIPKLLMVGLVLGLFSWLFGE